VLTHRRHLDLAWQQVLIDRNRRSGARGRLAQHLETIDEPRHRISGRLEAVESMVEERGGTVWVRCEVIHDKNGDRPEDDFFQHVITSSKRSQEGATASEQLTPARQ